MNSQLWMRSPVRWSGDGAAETNAGVSTMLVNTMLIRNAVLMAIAAWNRRLGTEHAAHSDSYYLKRGRTVVFQFFLFFVLDIAQHPGWIGRVETCTDHPTLASTKHGAIKPSDLKLKKINPPADFMCRHDCHIIPPKPPTRSSRLMYTLKCIFEKCFFFVCCELSCQGVFTLTLKTS